MLSWNLELGSKAAASSVAGILSSDADLVALQELTPDVATAIEADIELKTRYPYRILEPDDGVRGMGLLSRLPLTATHDTSAGLGFEGPPVLHAGMLTPDGRRVDVLDVHPFPPSITRLGGLPAGLDTRRRDADLAAIRSMIDGLADPSSALVVGDLNTSPFEAGYGTLVGRGLVDAHEAAGTGPGFTWRPSSLEGLGAGFLRIDHVISGAALRPISTSVDCSIAGDHCRLFATLASTDPGGATP